jgi:branched-chain amino acid transport system permease protein
MTDHPADTTTGTPSEMRLARENDMDLAMSRDPERLHWLAWGAIAVVMLVAPWCFTSGFALSLMSRMGIAIVFGLSFNLLFGQAGMLSFGHAVYAGLGAFAVVHALNRIGAGQLWLPVSLLPLVGGLAGALAAVVLGYIATRRSGTTFAMITLGIGELVIAAAAMVPSVFGGEAGISTNRVAGAPVFGITFGPDRQVYYLIALWCFGAMLAIRAWSRTPLGRIANAVRDNAERAAFIGYDPRRVRYLVLIAGAFFAGIAGGLSAILFEIASAEHLGAARSGSVLLATFIGGTGVFFGPVLGAVVYVLFAVALSGVTRAWLFYLGLLFVLTVMFAPGGLAGLAMRLTAWRHARARVLACGLAAGALLLAALVLTVEMVYRLRLDRDAGTVLQLPGIDVDASAAAPWLLAGACWLLGLVLLSAARRAVRGARAAGEGSR